MGIIYESIPSVVLSTYITLLKLVSHNYAAGIIAVIVSMIFPFISITNTIVNILNKDTVAISKHLANVPISKSNTNNTQLSDNNEQLMTQVVNSTIIQCATPTDLTKIETDISFKVNFAVRNYLYTNDLIIFKLIHVSVIFLIDTPQEPTANVYIATLKDHDYKNIVATSYVGSDLILPNITTIIHNTYILCTITKINQTEKTVIYLKFMRLPNNANNTISTSEYFVTDEITFITRLTNEQNTIYVNNFRLSRSLSCICSFVQTKQVTLSLAMHIFDGEILCNMSDSLDIGEYIIRIGTIDGSHNENELYTNQYKYNISIQYDIVSFEFGSISQSSILSKTDINQNSTNNVGISNLHHEFNINMSPFDLLIDASIIDTYIISYYVDKLHTIHAMIFKMGNANDNNESTGYFSNHNKMVLIINIFFFENDE